MTTGEIVLSVLAGLFVIAFGLWARRLDRALDVLEELQKEWFNHALAMEKRVTRIETKVGLFNLWNENQENRHGHQ